MLGDRIIKVKCNEQGLGFEIDFYIYQEIIGDEKKEGLKIAHIDSDGQLIFEPHKWASIAKPTFSLSHPIAKQLVNALNEIHVKPDEESKMAGLYEASQKHLEDMRKLVFKEVK